MNDARRRDNFRRFVLLCSVLLWPAHLATGAILLPGHQVKTYADVTDPAWMSFGSSGELYVGRDATGSGGGGTDAVRIHRVGPGGGPVTEYGSSAIRPDESVVTVFGPSSSFTNPNDMEFDSTGRLVFMDRSAKVFVSSGGSPTQLVSLPANGDNLAIDALDRIFTVTDDGVIRIWDSSGSLVDGSFATVPGPKAAIAFANGGPFGNNLYALSGGKLIRYSAGGSSTVLGTLLDPLSLGQITFGPDQGLYVSDFDGDQILRITPVPEPGSGMLLGLGVLALGMWRRFA